MPYLCLPSHLVHIMVFMASFRSSCSFVRNSFIDLESSDAAIRFLFLKKKKDHVVPSEL